MDRGDRVDEDPPIPQGREIGVGAHGAIDPVADELDPPVPRRRLARGLGGQVTRVVELDGERTDVALRPGDVAARPLQAGQVRPVVDPPRIHGGAAIPHREDAGAALRQDLGLLLLTRRRPRGSDSDVGVRIDESGEREADAIGLEALPDSRDALAGDPEGPPFLAQAVPALGQEGPGKDHLRPFSMRRTSSGRSSIVGRGAGSAEGAPKAEPCLPDLRCSGGRSASSS